MGVPGTLFGPVDSWGAAIAKLGTCSGTAEGDATKVLATGHFFMPVARPPFAKNGTSRY